MRRGEDKPRSPAYKIPKTDVLTIFKQKYVNDFYVNLFKKGNLNYVETSSVVQFMIGAFVQCMPMIAYL